jgi:hypothetical protein
VNVSDKATLVAQNAEAKALLWHCVINLTKDTYANTNNLHSHRIVSIAIAQSKLLAENAKAKAVFCAKPATQLVFKDKQNGFSLLL